MQYSATNFSRWLAALVGAAMLAACPVRAEDEPKVPSPVRLTLDRPVDAVAAPFVLAATRGLYRAEGLIVSTNVASAARKQSRALPQGPATWPLPTSTC